MDRDLEGDLMAASVCGDLPLDEGTSLLLCRGWFRDELCLPRLGLYTTRLCSIDGGRRERRRRGRRPRGSERGFGSTLTSCLRTKVARPRLRERPFPPFVLGRKLEADLLL